MSHRGIHFQTNYVDKIDAFSFYFRHFHFIADWKQSNKNKILNEKQQQQQTWGKSQRTHRDTSWQKLKEERSRFAEAVMTNA